MLNARFAWSNRLINVIIERRAVRCSEQFFRGLDERTTRNGLIFINFGINHVDITKYATLRHIRRTFLDSQVAEQSIRLILVNAFFYFVDSKLKGVEANVGTAVGEQVR